MNEWLMNPLFLILGITTLIGGGIWIGKITEHKNTVQDFMGQIRKDVDETRADIKRILERMPPAVTESNSPVALTSLGHSDDNASCSNYGKHHCNHA